MLCYFCEGKLIPEIDRCCDREKLKKNNELFEKFSYVDIERCNVRIAFLGLQRHLLNDLVDQLPVLHADLLTAIYKHPAAPKTEVR